MLVQFARYIMMIDNLSQRNMYFQNHSKPSISF